MELFSIKPKEINDPAVSNNKGNMAISALKNLSFAFKELINKSSGQGERGGAFDVLSKQFSSADRVDSETRTKEISSERGDLGHSNRDDYSGSSEEHSPRNDQHAKPIDDYDNNNSRSDERSELADESHGDTVGESDSSGVTHEQPRDLGRDNTSDSGDKVSSQGQAQTENSNQNQEQSTTNNGEKDAVQGNMPNDSANLALASAAALSQIAANQATTNENAGTTAGTSAQHDGAIQGIAAATSNSGNNAPANNGNNQANANTNISANTPVKANTGSEVQGQGERSAINSPAVKNTGAEVQGQGERSAINSPAVKNTGAEVQSQGARSAANARAAQQASEIANRVGTGPKISVTVNVADEAETIVSKPTSTLTTASLKATESNATGQTAQQAAGRNNQGANSAAITHSGPQVKNGRSEGKPQQANALQAQIQASNSTGGNTKATAPGPVNIAAPSQTAASVGNESATPSAIANTSDTQQSKDNQAAKETQTQRFTPQRQPVADQVSVQINKAIKAGLDRISIQLRPENLGRVDVKMDISRDGGVSVAIIADNKDTMELLQRDAKELLKALADAGLKAGSGDLNFNLRGEQNQNSTNGDDSGSSKNSNRDNADTNDNLNADNPNLAAHEIGDIITETRVDVRA